MQNKFNEWQANYDAAVARISKYLKPNPQHSVQMHPLVEWMISTDINPFGYLPLEWAGTVNNATTFVSLLDHIYHALYDDGDIAFVTVNNEPRIVFVNPYDDNFNAAAITANDRALAERRTLINGSDSISVTVLDITPAEFGPIREAYEIKQMKRGFAFEAARYGIDFAVRTASRSKLYNPAWIEECAEQIAKYQAAFNSANVTV